MAINILLLVCPLLLFAAIWSFDQGNKGMAALLIAVTVGLVVVGRSLPSDTAQSDGNECTIENAGYATDC